MPSPPKVIGGRGGVSFVADFRLQSRPGVNSRPWMNRVAFWREDPRKKIKHVPRFRKSKMSFILEGQKKAQTVIRAQVPAQHCWGWQNPGRERLVLYAWRRFV